MKKKVIAGNISAVSLRHCEGGEAGDDHEEKNICLRMNCSSALGGGRSEGRRNLVDDGHHGEDCAICDDSGGNTDLFHLFL